jgi:hypothetical protein
MASTALRALSRRVSWFSELATEQPKAEDSMARPAFAEYSETRALADKLLAGSTKSLTTEQGIAGSAARATAGYAWNATIAAALAIKLARDNVGECVFIEF